MAKPTNFCLFCWALLLIKTQNSAQKKLGIANNLLKSNLQYLVFQEESASRQIKVENRIQTHNRGSILSDKHKIKPQQRMDDIEVLDVEDIEVLEEQK